MKFSKTCLHGVVCFLFRSLATSDCFPIYGLKTQVPSSPNPTQSPNLVSIVGDTSVSNGYGSMNAFNYEIKRLVPPGPNSAESLDPVPPMKYYLV